MLLHYRGKSERLKFVANIEQTANNMHTFQWSKRQMSRACTWYSPPQRRTSQVWHTLARDGLHKHAFLHEWNEPYVPLPLSRSWSSFTEPGWMGGWTGLGTTTAHDRCVTEIVVSCSDRHASLGNWSAAVVSVELTIFRVVCRDADHWATESPKLRVNPAIWLIN